MLREQEQLTWYTRRDGITRGPFTAESITRYLLLGRIHLDDEISHDGEQWQKASSFGEFLPPELANLSTWEDYQQLVIVRMEADERKGERRAGDSTDWLKHRPERRLQEDRRKGESVLPVSQYLFSDVVSSAAGKRRGPGMFSVLLSLLLVVLVFAFLLPSRI